MALKKSELYSSLWKSCDELRGGMDASQYKDYVLILLFVKYVSDKYAGDRNALIDVPLPQGDKPGGSFADMVAAKGNIEIGDKLNKIIARLALGKGKEMVDRLTKLVSIFEGLDFGSNRAEGDDLLGDAYEYLMCHFATESGKSKGQFYTPPANLFYGTGIPACIIVLDKEGAAGRKGMVDASKGFIKDGNKNRLRAQDIHKIVDTFTRQRETPKYSRSVSLAEVEANDFNLNLPRYIDSTEPEDLQDIKAHLMGGIPHADIDGLGAYWQVFPNVRKDLFAPANRPGYGQPRVEAAQVKSAIFAHPEFTAFNTQVTTLFATWTAANIPLLTGILQGQRPKALIERLAKSLQDTFRTHAPVASLIDPYGVYQHLMDYWAETMQDDAWMIVSDGWQAVQAGKPNTDLIPPALVVARYFASEHQAIEQLEAVRDAITRQMEELDEDHGGEDGLLSDAKNDKGKLTKVSAKAQLAKIRHDKTALEERMMLENYVELTEQEATASKKVKDATKALDARVTAQYSQLSADDIKTLVVTDKWLATLATSVQGELDRVSQALTGRIKQLTERYATPIPQLTAEVVTLSERVDSHLKKMGFVWN